MRENPPSTPGGFNDETLPLGSMEKCEPDWDYSYDASTARDSDPSLKSLKKADSIERERSSALQQQDQSRRRRHSSSRRNKNKPPPLLSISTPATRKMSRLEILCANHECAVQQEPDTLYYQTITLERPKKRPEPSHRGRSVVDVPRSVSKTSRLTARRTVEENVRSMVASKQRKEAKGGREHKEVKESKERREHKLVTPKKHIHPPKSSTKTQSEPKRGIDPPLPSNKTANSPPKPYPTKAVSDSSVPKIVFEREETSPSAPVAGCAMPSFPFAVARASPTSVDDIVEELTDLQGQLDSLRITKPNASLQEALLDAVMAAECKKDAGHANERRPKAERKQRSDSEFKAGQNDIEDHPKLDEELIDGVPFRAFGSDANERVESPFSLIIDALHQYEPPVVEDVLVDPGVRVRNFGSESDAPPDMKISVYTDDASENSANGSVREAPAAPLNKARPKPASSTEPLVSLLKKKNASASQEPEVIQVTKTKPSFIFRASTAAPPTPGSGSNRSPSSGSTPASSKRAFSLLGAIASVRGKSSSPPAVVEVPSRKSVRFSKKLVSSVQYRPKTLPHEMEDLFFSPEELAELERDRNERVYEEQFETIVAPDSKRVSVTYPVRRVVTDLSSEQSSAPVAIKQSSLSSLPDVERTPVVEPSPGVEPSQVVEPSPDVEPTPVVESPPPELVDISGSWSEGSENVAPSPEESFEI